ncbi:MAG: DUF4097 family beta strand repeat-containing protein [Bullifex sp.]
MLRISKRAIVLLIIILAALWIGIGLRTCSFGDAFAKDSFSYTGSTFTMKAVAADVRIIEADTDRVKLEIDGRTEYLSNGGKAEARKSEQVTVTIPRNLSIVKAETVSGTIEAYNLSADDIGLSSVSGSVRGSDTGRAGNVLLETVSGSISFDSKTENTVKAESVSGSISLSADAKNISTHSVRGGIDINANGHDYALIFSSVSGSWSYEGTYGGGKGTVKNGTYGTIYAKTVSGSIKIN